MRSPAIVTGSWGSQAGSSAPSLRTIRQALAVASAVFAAIAGAAFPSLLQPAYLVAASIAFLTLWRGAGLDSSTGRWMVRACFGAGLNAAAEAIPGLEGTAVAQWAFAASLLISVISLVFVLDQRDDARMGRCGR